MQTIKFTLQPESQGGQTIQIQTEAFVETTEEAEQAGERAAHLLKHFMKGFGQTDITDDYDD